MTALANEIGMFRFISHQRQDWDGEKPSTVSEKLLTTEGPRSRLFALYQGTTSVVPPSAKMVRALAPATVKSEPKFQEKEAQGLKPNSFLRLCGTTKVVP
jgi:hypothetical protein